jgi:hypothetical protein
MIIPELIYTKTKNMKKYHLLFCFFLLISCVKDTAVTSSTTPLKIASRGDVEKVNTWTIPDCRDVYHNVIVDSNSTLTQIMQALVDYTDCFMNADFPKYHPNTGTSGGLKKDSPGTPVYFTICSYPGEFNELLNLLNLTETSSQAETDAAAAMLKKYNAIIVQAIDYYKMDSSWCLIDKTYWMLQYGRNNGGFTDAELVFFAKYIDVVYRDGFVVNRSWLNKLYYQEFVFTYEDGTTEMTRVMSFDFDKLQIPRTFN